MLGKPGLSSFDKFAMGSAIKSELLTTAGNLIGLNSTLMKLSNGDDSGFGGVPDPSIGARAVRVGNNQSKATSRRIGQSASSSTGGLGPMSTAARTANLLGNPTMRRYEKPNANGTFNFGLAGSPSIGEYYDVYESEEHRVRLMDDTVGRDLFGYTHLATAAQERNGSEENDNIYLRSTYGIFSDVNFPFDKQDIQRNILGPKKYSPSDPYVLVGLENPLLRRTMNGDLQAYDTPFEAFLPDRPPYMGSLLNMWDYMGSHVYLNILNGVMEHGLYAENYEYDRKDRNMVYDRGAIPQSDYPYFLDVISREVNIAGGTDGAIDWDNSGIRTVPEKEIKGLINKTNRMFYDGKIKSLVNRFATLNGNDEGRPDFLNTATDHIYGLSRGRNLRKVDLTYENGYPNPYCRVWTTHYQYSKYKHLIRGKWDTSFTSNATNSGNEHFTLHEGDQLMRPNNGYDRFRRMSSLNSENGRPIYAPYYVNDRGVLEKDSIKRCMFSIENLAWKDIIPDSTVVRIDGNEKFRQYNITGKTVFSEDHEGHKYISSEERSVVHERKGIAKGFGMTLTEEQRGPNGGRIMWFPPYNLKFTEDLSAEWNDERFIGRGEPLYSYVNARRSGTLDFTILVDHPSIINEWARGGKNGKTANKANPLSKDEMILRYFAGCDSLEFKPRKEYDVPYTKTRTETTTMTLDEVKNEVEEKKTEKKTREVKTTKENTNGEPTITFYSVFYFPNDYSAQDFNEKKKGSGKPGEGIDEMFKKGKRDNGTVGYELGNGGKGMEYDIYPNKKYYFSGPDKHKKRGKSDGKINEWYYPVDTRVNDERLQHGDLSYHDPTDFGLNRTLFAPTGTSEGGGTIKGYWEEIPSETEIRDYLNNGNVPLENISDAEKISQIKDAMTLVKLSDKEKKYFIASYNFYQNLSDVVTKLNSVSNNAYHYEIFVQGFASSQGYTSSNKILARNRATVIANWIESLGKFDTTNGKDKIVISDPAKAGQIEGTGDSSIPECEFRPKAARAALVTFKIYQDKEEITDVQEYEDVIVEKHDVYEMRTGSTEYKVEEKDYFDTSASGKFENQTYDDEYAYFKMITEEDDMVKRYISDKVDYFDPAFHSITPEGFNARLTFLNQCTRQGPTISASDLGRGSSYGAGNLAFGRPPICVLRIGDFYNTKICIESIGITYDNDGMKWDTNPEGIGLQPMMANVHISFNFIGGSDLSGPISRLQNAVSHNFYANTSVYDRRADYRNHFIGSKELEGKDTAQSWSPVIIERDNDANVTTHTPFSTKGGNK